MLEGLLGTTHSASHIVYIYECANNGVVLKESNYFRPVLNLESLLRKLNSKLIKSNPTEHWAWGLRGPSLSHGYHH